MGVAGISLEFIGIVTPHVYLLSPQHGWPWPGGWSPGLCHAGRPSISQTLLEPAVVRPRSHSPITSKRRLFVSTDRSCTHISCRVGILCEAIRNSSEYLLPPSVQTIPGPSNRRKPAEPCLPNRSPYRFTVDHPDRLSWASRRPIMTLERAIGKRATWKRDG